MNKSDYIGSRKFAQAEKKFESVEVVFKDSLNKFDINFIVKALDGKANQLGSKKILALRLLRWYTRKKQCVYSIEVNNSKLHKQLYKKPFIWNVAQYRKKNKKEYLLNQVIEFVFWDLLKAYFSLKKSPNVEVLKTSNFDDINSGVDFLLIGDYARMGIDISLLQSKSAFRTKQKRKNVTPIEYNIYNGKEIIKNNLRIDIDEKDAIKFKRYVLLVEPVLATLFSKNYVYAICQNSNTILSNDKILSIRNNTLDHYCNTTNKGIYKGKTSEDILSLVDRTTSNLFKLFDKKYVEKQQRKTSLTGSRKKGFGQKKKERRTRYKEKSRAIIL